MKNQIKQEKRYRDAFKETALQRTLRKSLYWFSVTLNLGDKRNATWSAVKTHILNLYYHYNIWQIEEVIFICINPSLTKKSKNKNPETKENKNKKLASNVTNLVPIFPLILILSFHL